MNEKQDVLEKELFGDDAPESAATKSVFETPNEPVPTPDDVEQESMVLQWEAPEFVYHPKDRFWYSIAGAVTILGAINAYLIDNPLFAVLILIGGLIVIATAGRKPDTVVCRLDWQGISIGDKRRSYFEFESFWIVEKEEENILILTPIKTLQTETIVPLGDVPPEHVYRYMRYHLPDMPTNEPFAHRISNYLGF